MPLEELSPTSIIGKWSKAYQNYNAAFLMSLGKKSKVPILDASLHLYMKVGWSVGPSFCLSVGNANFEYCKI